MTDLPSGFYRAEAAWLNPPEYKPHPEDLAEDIERVCNQVDSLIRDFSEEYISDGENFYETEESSHVGQFIEGARELVKKLTPLMQELEEYEEEPCGPDPDAAYDHWAATGEVI